MTGFAFVIPVLCLCAPATTTIRAPTTVIAHLSVSDITSLSFADITALSFSDVTALSFCDVAHLSCCQVPARLVLLVFYSVHGTVSVHVVSWSPVLFVIVRHDISLLGLCSRVIAAVYQQFLTALVQASLGSSGEACEITRDVARLRRVTRTRTSRAITRSPRHGRPRLVTSSREIANCRRPIAVISLACSTPATVSDVKLHILCVMTSRNVLSQHQPSTYNNLVFISLFSSCLIRMQLCERCTGRT